MSPDHMMEEVERELNEAVYHGLYNSMSTGLQICRLVYDKDGRADDYVVLAVNHAYEVQSGLRKEDIVGRRASDVLPDLDKAWIELVGEVVRDQAAASIEEHHATRDMWFKVTASPLPGRDMFVIAYEDVTESRKVRQGFPRKSEERYRNLFENITSPLAVYEYVYDEEGEVDHWTLQDTNRAGLKLLGKGSLDEVRGRNESELYGPRNREARLSLIRELRRTGQPMSEELFFDWNESYQFATLFPLDADHFASMVLDITDIRRAQRRAEESESSLVLSLKASRSMAYSVNPTTGEVHSMKGVGWLLGYPPEEVTMSLAWWDEHIHMDDLPLCQAALGKIKERPGEHKLFYRVRSRNGDWLHVEDNAISISGPNGRIDRIVGTVTDITARKLAEEKASRYSSELKRSNTELQQFAYVASHDLQEPLRMVTMYLGLLEKNSSSELGPEGREFTRYAVEGSRRMRELIDDLLQYSRIDSQPVEPELVDMSEVMALVMSDLKVPIEESGARLAVEPLPIVCADRHQMRQLMTNLVSNAVKFRSDRPPSVEVSSTAGEDEFTISVKDNGIGIEPEFGDKLFKMFSRLHTREEFPGTGIGLAVAKKIVERHGGRIWFESEPGEGTIFSFTLPA